MPKIILASQSPRRKQLLEWAEVDFEILVEPTDESFPEGLNPEAAALHIARQKAAAIRPKAGDRTVIPADTIVAADNK